MKTPESHSDPLANLRHEILMARGRVYEVGKPTPLEKLLIDDDTTLYLKREDLSPMHAYKWRGAYNKMAQLDQDSAKGVVAASAGNHAQGVAIAAAKFGGKIKAKIFMPLNTPQMKQDAVRRLGGDAVTIDLIGDRYDDAVEAAKECAEKEGYVMVHAFDDYAVMGGQGTIADEVVMSGEGPFDAAFLQIGGGGMAAGVAAWLKTYYPDITIYGVEGKDQASMAAAVEAGEPVTLPRVDVFCDGTAVAKAGAKTFEMCNQLIDKFLTVSNEEVCAAMQFLWERKRIIPEPAGAMGLAGWLTHRDHLPRHKNILTIICGSNMDFAQLQRVVRAARIGSSRRRYLRFEIMERPGTLFQLLHELRTKASIVEFQYGKVSPEKAWPVIGFDSKEESFTELEKGWEKRGLRFEDVTGEPDIEFRAIRYDPALLHVPLFLQVEFSERAGALAAFLEGASALSDFVYFNYQYSGERVGRALIGFDFPDQQAREKFLEYAHGKDHATRSVVPLTEDQMTRVLGF
ncbi:MAG: pyridoxal-phosphate dependent enzyme [Verrucomicrobiales bacterium]|nr:pyridoxal-phosphate dependent enzyme [Verrucomicrobiales bacterium]